MTAACEQTGLGDFGGDSFREGLDVYCRSLATESQLNDLGMAALTGNITGNLTNRLRVVDWTKQHPEVAAEAIDAPLVVIGVFRAGTTLLSYLLDQDPRNRPLLRWEAGDNVPPPTPEEFRSGDRVEAARAAGSMLDAINPGFKAIHHEEADGPTECVALLSQDFKSLLWETIANVPSYGEWLLGVDQRSAYEHHRRVLQVLQSGGVRGRWTLKSPHHAIALDALTAVYPGARLVMLHRDPVVVTASVCSLVRSLSGTFTDADHGDYINRRWPEVLQASIDGPEAFRASHPEHPIIDVRYADLVRDPVGTVRAIYAGAGWTLEDDAEAAMRRYVTENPKGKFGRHGYDMEALGLDPAALAERFGDYMERHEVPSERPAPR